MNYGEAYIFINHIRLLIIRLVLYLLVINYIYFTVPLHRSTDYWMWKCRVQTTWPSKSRYFNIHIQFTSDNYVYNRLLDYVAYIWTRYTDQSVHARESTTILSFRLTIANYNLLWDTTCLKKPLYTVSVRCMYVKEYSTCFFDLIFVYRVDCFFPLTRSTCQER